MGYDDLAIFKGICVSRESDILDERISVLSCELSSKLRSKFTNFNRILSGLKITFHLNEKLFRRTCNEVSLLLSFSLLRNQRVR